MARLSLQTLQTLFSAPRLGEPGARAPLFTPDTDKLRLDSPFPFLGSGKGLGVQGCWGGGQACCMCGKRVGKDGEERQDAGRKPGGGGGGGQDSVCVHVRVHTGENVK